MRVLLRELVPLEVGNLQISVSSNGMKIIEYFKETKGEFKHVNWPTRKQTIAYTLMVILISVALAYYLGFFDFVFSAVLQKILP